jgi:hypothetical protein
MYLDTLRELQEQLASIAERNALRAAEQRIALGEKHCLHPTHSPKRERATRVISRWADLT